MRKIPVSFSTQFDMYVSSEVCHVGSGAAPNTSDSIVLRNSSCDASLLTTEVQEACKQAWENGESALESFVRRTFFPVGRAADTRFWRGDDE